MLQKVHMLAHACLRRRARMPKGLLLGLVWGIPPKERRGALGRWQVPVAFPITWPTMQWPAGLGWPWGRLNAPAGACRRGRRVDFGRGRRPAAGLWLLSGLVPVLVAGQVIAVSVLTSRHSSSSSCFPAALELGVSGVCSHRRSEALRKERDCKDRV